VDAGERRAAHVLGGYVREHVLYVLAVEVAEPVGADGRDELLLDRPGEAVDRVLAPDFPGVQAAFQPGASMSATVSSALPIGTPSLIFRSALSSLSLASAFSFAVTLMRLRPSLAAGSGTVATLPRLRDRWGHPRHDRQERRTAFRFTAPERNAIYGRAARQAAAAAEHIRRCAHGDPSAAADAAWAAADTLHVAARVLRSPALRCAADAYDRAARSPHGRVPHRTRDGDQLRATARLVALLGNVSGDRTLASVALVANLEPAQAIAA
jgi:hypothetical protein